MPYNGQSSVVLLIALSLFAIVIVSGCLAGEIRAPDWKTGWNKRGQANEEIVHYFQQRQRNKVALLRKRHKLRGFFAEADEIRKALRKTYLMPKTSWNGSTILIRETMIDGINVEIRTLSPVPGIYSVLRIFKPMGKGKHPAMFFLPGHGEPPWDSVVQRRGLVFAKMGYIAVLIDPYGQGELADTYGWNEYHGSQANAYLLPTGQSLLGVIMATHSVELSYICSRSDVDTKRVVIMGGSMGGTHTLYLAAIDQRVKAAVAVSVAPELEPRWGVRMHCICDDIAGVYNAADADVIRSLVSPRPLMVIYPDLEAPVTEAGDWLINIESLDPMDKNAKAKYFLSDDQIARQYAYASEVYRLSKTPDRFRETVVNGPHGDAKQYRELAYGWFAHFLMGKDSSSSIPEPSVTPVYQSDLAKAAMLAWPDGHRPADFMGPTEYAKKSISTLVAKLPNAPANGISAKRYAKTLRWNLDVLLGVRVIHGVVKSFSEGKVDVEGILASKYLVEPEPDAKVHMLLFAPSKGVRPNGRLYVMIDPLGVLSTAESADRIRLTDSGSWVACADLRGIGSLPDIQAAYVGNHDQPLCDAALKLGEPLAGLWANDLLAIVNTASKAIGSKVRVVVSGKREMGLAAILAASRSQSIDAVETHELLASYYSPKGYGWPYVYGDTGRHNDNLGGYGSMVPCIPNILKYADIPQLAAMVCPRPLTITSPVLASGEMVGNKNLQNAFAWTKRFYKVSGCSSRLIINYVQLRGVCRWIYSKLYRNAIVIELVMWTSLCRVRTW